MAPTTRIAATAGPDGHIRTIEQDIPEGGPGMVLVEVHASLVSPGTELKGWRAFSERRKKPETGDARTFGYSNAGIVIETADDVVGLKVGDRVACIGGNYAMHTDYARVPCNLCVGLPENLSFEQGAYAMLSATALHAVRRGEPELGHYVAVAGLGIVGQLAAALYRLAGCYVIGWDTISFRTEKARSIGTEAVLVGAEDEVKATASFTDGRGLDIGVIAIGGDAERAYQSLEASMKVSPDGHPMGSIVVVGGASFNYASCLTNVDIRRSSRTGAGYHDEVWERGRDYPPVFMRWTTQTNLQLCMGLISEGRLPVGELTTHRIPLEKADEETQRILDKPDEILGVIFTMNGA